jgi:hypothetical protein
VAAEEAQAVRLAQAEEDSRIIPPALVRFDPSVPCVSLVHVYLLSNVAAALTAREEVLNGTGVAVIPKVLKLG